MVAVEHRSRMGAGMIVDAQTAPAEVAEVGPLPL
jgi:hypothetical protein